MNALFISLYLFEILNLEEEQPVKSSLASRSQAYKPQQSRTHTGLLFRVSGAIEDEMAFHSRLHCPAALRPWKLSYAPCQQVFVFFFLLLSASVFPFLVVFFPPFPSLSGLSFSLYEGVQWRLEHSVLVNGPNGNWRVRERYCVDVSERASCTWSKLSQWSQHKQIHSSFANNSLNSHSSDFFFSSFLAPFHSLHFPSRPLLLCSFCLRSCLTCPWGSLFVLCSDEVADDASRRCRGI